MMTMFMFMLVIMMTIDNDDDYQISIPFVEFGKMQADAGTHGYDTDCGVLGEFLQRASFKFAFPNSPQNLWMKSKLNLSGIGDGIAITGSGYAQGGNYDYITIPR